jgi:hypothetical protein
MLPITSTECNRACSYRSKYLISLANGQILPTWHKPILNHARP